MKKNLGLILAGILVIAIIDSADYGWAKYKTLSWDIRARDSYAASLTSEGVTIAIEPLFTDAAAAKVFDKTDMITRGIMPLAVIIFNDNDYSVEVDGLSVELIHKDQHIRTMPPNEVVYRLFQKDKKWKSQPPPKLSRAELNDDALDDFDSKFLMKKSIPSHGSGGGFLFFHIPDSEETASFLSQSLVYIPKVFRKDTGARLIFFEIELAPALKSIAP
jgi:hypothetical protein